VEGCKGLNFKYASASGAERSIDSWCACLLFLCAEGPVGGLFDEQVMEQSLSFTPSCVGGVLSTLVQWGIERARS
jgi:hypothetical protein